MPTPRGGGLACAVGAIVGASVSRTRGSGATRAWIASSAALGAVGRVDDLAQLSATPRLGAQFAVGAIVGGVSGGALGAAFGAVATPAIVNAFNFMDGINGISGGTALAWGLSVATEPSLDLGQKTQAMVTAGMALGFLPYNVPKATMFLGDVGSYLLGAGIAVTVIQSAFEGGQLAPRRLSGTLAPLAPYLADTGTTILKRAARGESLTVAHREHAYQRLVQAGEWPHWRVAAFASGAAGLCGLAGRSRYGAAAIVPVVALYLFAPGLVAAVRKKQAQDEPTRFGGRN
ncbi:hypothetical protein G6023_03440 [Dietzia sp. DQ11-71]|nr:hypothetical protein [Dietzia sp. DQ11-71]